MLLRESDYVTLDGSGNGTVRMAPDGSHEYWMPESVAVKVSTAVAEAQCSVYIGPKIADEYFVDGTFSGSSGAGSDLVAGHEIGQLADPYIWAVWTGGDPGAQATLRVIGKKEIR